MVRRFEINEYIRPAERGINLPLMLRGRDDSGQDATMFVKTTAGFANRKAAPGIELFTTMLGRELGLTLPEPVLVTIPSGFENSILNAPQHRVLVGKSAGTNFGTIALGNDWKTWLPGMPTRSFPERAIEDILTFDAIVQHTDRGPDNPNLLWQSDKIALLDHEKCFSHLHGQELSPNPWRDFLSLRPFQHHCLFGSRGNLKEQFGRETHLRFLDEDFMNRVDSFVIFTMNVFPDSGVEMERVLEYISCLNKNGNDFFQYLRMCLFP